MPSKLARPSMESYWLPEHARMATCPLPHLLTPLEEPPGSHPLGRTRQAILRFREAAEACHAQVWVDKDGTAGAGYEFQRAGRAFGHDSPGSPQIGAS